MNSNERLIKMKPSSKFLLTMLTKIVKTIKENGESYKVRDVGKNYICYMWETASICASVVKKQNAKGYIVHIIFRSDDIGTDVTFFIDTEDRTVKSNSTILSFLTKKPKTAPLVLKSLDALKEFIDEVIDAIPIEDDKKPHEKPKHVITSQL
ncbi:MAG: hypothetical protein QXX36_03590 [Candidatus Rehaiarchaeum fermentans]|nr:hypothetical protein [Candidatus Rehaiarchaeum fermentans]